MFTIIKNVSIYSPQNLGKKDLLVCGEKIAFIGENIEINGATVIDKDGMILISGFIDQHVHITGGGGEGGFHTRVPEVMLTDLIKGGVTTVVGMLGTDSITRSVENLVAKTKALKNEGISAYCLTGSYKYPSPTITGSIEKDITFIDEVIGVKIALSDHRESFITKDELARLSSEVRIASMVAGKPGIITIHMGDDKKMMQMVKEFCTETSFPLWHFRPTHVDRNDSLFKDALSFLGMGGRIDLTVGNDYQKTMNNLNTIKNKCLTLENVTITSDGNGSYSSYDATGKLTKIGASLCNGIINATKYLINKGYSIEEAIRFGTVNVADGLYLSHRKGRISVGYDADFLILDDNFDLDTVFANGHCMMKDKEIVVKGTFEN